MKAVVSMNPQGRLTVPAAARAALHVEGPAEFELEVTEDAFILRPAHVIPDDDTWAYTPDHIVRVDRARREGKSQKLTEADLARTPNG